MGDQNNLEPETTPGPGAAGLTPPLDDAQPVATAAPEAAKGDVKGLSPGQRLKAKKAQKALQKREFKAELERQEEEKREQERAEAERILGRSPETPALPSQVDEAAGQFTGYMQTNRKVIVAGVVFVFVLGLLAVILKDRLSAGSAAQAELLRAALETAAANVDPEGKPVEGEAPVFKTREDKLTQAASLFGGVAKSDPATQVAGWASAAEAATKLQLGQAEEAAKLFKAVVEAKPKMTELAVRAHEGWAISLEVMGKTDEALAQLEKLGAAHEGAAKDLAEYHVARIKLAKGEREEAKKLLKTVYDRLLADTSSNNSRSAFLRGEVEGRLAEIDSSLVREGGGSEQFSQEQIQRLIEQLKQQQGKAPAGAEGAGE